MWSSKGNNIYYASFSVPHNWDVSWICYEDVGVQYVADGEQLTVSEAAAEYKHL
jgi:hypothetical protein